MQCPVWSWLHSIGPYARPCLFDKDRIKKKKKEKSLFPVGPEEPQACPSVADKPGVPAQTSSYGGLLLHRAPGLGNSGQVGPRWRDML